MAPHDHTPSSKETAPQTARLFLAIPLWGRIAPTAASHFSRLVNDISAIRWVRPELWHITLHFLGNTPLTGVPQIGAEIAQAVSQTPRFGLTLGGLGGFPRLSKARVVWVGASQGEAELKSLANRVRAACVEAGYPGDKKPFAPHFTLGRARSTPVSVDVPSDLYEADWGSITVESVALVRSDLGPNGPTYTVLEEYQLEG